MPVRLEQAYRCNVARIEAGEAIQGAFLHVLFDAAPLAVELVQILCDVERATRVVGDQAFDAQAHVGHPTGGVEAGAKSEPEIEGARTRRLTAGHTEQRTQARLHAAATNPRESLRDEDAIVVIESDHVGDGAQRHQVEQAAQIRLLGCGKGTAFAELGTQCEHGVEHHPDAGQ